MQTNKPVTPKPPALASMFEKVLRAYETQGISYSDVLAQLRRMLATGCSPVELSAILGRRKLNETLPEYAQLQSLLDEAVAQSAAAAADAAAPPAQAPPQPYAEEVTVDLDFDAVDGQPETLGRLWASELDISTLATRLRSMEERAPARRSAVDSLRHSHERAKEAESAAARATALAADLEAARAALLAERDRVLQLDKALSESVASGKALQEQALQDAQRHQAESQRHQAESQRHQAESQRHQAQSDSRQTELDTALRTLAEREAMLEQLRLSLREREARVEALTAERETALEHLRSALAEREARIAQLSAEHARLTRETQRAVVPRADAPQAARLAQAVPRGVGWAVAAIVLAMIMVVGRLYIHRSPAAASTLAAAPSPGTVVRDCSTCPAMTILPAGRFKQGAAAGSSVAKPLHWVAIQRPIAMSTNPITLEDFQQFAAATGRDMRGCDVYDGEWTHQADSSWEQPGFAQTGQHPVTCVSWNDAAAYAAWLSTKTGHHYRLPSASEWEYAARAGDDTDSPWSAQGQDACIAADVADLSAARRYPGWTTFPCDDGYVYTAPVGAFKSNAFGLGDMLGNVLQWTADCWHADYAGAPVDGSAWMGGDCSQHELRGASWFSSPAHARADYRDHFAADYRTSSAGIRLVRDPQP